MITFMSILSLDEKWMPVLEERAIGREEFARDFMRFITPAVDVQATKKKPHTIDIKGFELFGFFLQEPVEIDYRKKRPSS